MDWKGIIEKVIIAVVAGAILGIFGWILGRATAPETPSVRAQLKWVDVESDQRVYGALLKNRGDMEKAFGTVFEMTGIEKALEDIGSRLRVATLKVENNTSVRTQEVEVYIQGRGIVTSPGAVVKSTAVVSELKLKPLDPGDSTIVYILAKPWSPYTSDPVRVIYDGRKVDIMGFDYLDEQYLFGIAVTSYPILIVALLGAGVLFVVIVGAAIASELVYAMKPDFKTRCFREFQ